MWINQVDGLVKLVRPSRKGKPINSLMLIRLDWIIQLVMLIDSDELEVLSGPTKLSNFSELIKLSVPNAQGNLDTLKYIRWIM